MQAPDDGSRSRRPPGFNLIGQVSSNTGLGVAGRAIADLILHHGAALAIHDLAAGLNRDGADLRHREYFVAAVQDLPYDINLVVLGDGGLQATMRREGEAWRRNGYFTAGMGFWELASLPPRWLPALDSLDAFVCATDFIRHTHEAGLSGPRILEGRIAHDLPNNLDSRRERFGLPADEIVFVTGFEPHSDVERKNVWAVIEAFTQSTRASGRGLMIVKVNNPWQADGSEHPVLKRLRATAESFPRIRVLTDAMTYRDVISLYDACDVYVSLHRAEGLGLGIVEAMALGKPVIATAWSGNMTYMNHFNSLPVGYRLVPISRDSEFYRRSELDEATVWADPNVTEAAQYMRQLMDDAPMRERLGAAAKESIATHNARAGSGRFLDELRIVRERLTHVPRAVPSNDRQTEARLLQTSRVAQIQQLERELQWLRSRRVVRAGEQVKRIFKSFA